ncbi:hypothetical protein AMECASPLE_036298 [Ameca splendens]|uniref:Uncharacterized protein n=1 Tax=Ameca splendens TaxID=208324 RepID=A0ABV1A2Y8_9TELE
MKCCPDKLGQQTNQPRFNTIKGQLAYKQLSNSFGSMCSNVEYFEFDRSSDLTLLSFLSSQADVQCSYQPVSFVLVSSPTRHIRMVDLLDMKAFQSKIQQPFQTEYGKKLTHSFLS